MSTIPIQPININRFWEKTPTPLKYILLIALILAGSYFLVSKKLDNNQLKELEKIEQGIEVTYTLVDKFEAFQQFQNQYNNQIIKDIKNIYTLVTELNDNVNKKFNYLINNSNNNKELLDMMNILNDSFEKLSNAYKPEIQTQEQPKYTPVIMSRKVDKSDTTIIIK